MAIVLSERNKDALRPIFKPWEEPTGHRVPGKSENSPALVEPGRRPSRCSLVRSIRAEVDLWRRGGYAGVSETSRYLLNYWFNTDHNLHDKTSGEIYQFRYYWAQREAIESIIYLFELRRVRNVASLLTDFGNGIFDDLALGIRPEDDKWLRACCKIATGGGKTKVMSLVVVWSYFNALKEMNTDLSKHFVIIAPNLTVYERLKDDFENNKIFYTDPLIPEEWRGDFQINTLLQDEPGGDASLGAIYLTNIHRLYDPQKANDESQDSIWGPEVKKATALDTSIALRERISSHQNIMILNDEAHHLHDPELAWNKAIDSLHLMGINKGKQGVSLQMDFTATPKHNNGGLFRHIICDYPLGEAVDSGIVKVPVLGESKLLNIQGDEKAPTSEKYSNHLKLGYQRYEEAYKEWEKVRKPILFVMTEDSGSANEVAQYLDSEAFPLLKGRVLNIHTNLKGKIKTTSRSGRKIQEFVESERDMKPEDLKILREMSRELDSPNSKYRCIVSVMMLREGWDIKNVTTIVPLRPYTAASGILPEQTLGRGLRRMIPFGEIPEMVTVIHHPAFRRLYEEELQIEGVNVLVIPERETIKQTVTIFVDHENKSVPDLDISVPFISDAIETSSRLESLAIEDVLQEFKKYQKLPIGKPKSKEIEFKERHMFTAELIGSWKLDLGLLSSAWSTPHYFANILARACKITDYQKVLLPVLEEFITKHLFEIEVDLYSGEIDHRMRDVDVKEHVLAVFSPLIMDKKTVKQNRKKSINENQLSAWKPFQASSTEKRPAIAATKTMFNLVPCDSSFEQEFSFDCDRLNDVVAFAKNTGPQKLTIDYLKPDKHRALYVPDFFVRTNNGDVYLCELKGREDNLTALKAKAAIEWCKTASKGNTNWHYLYIPYHLFQQSPATTLEELARACKPSLNRLLEEGESDQIFIDFDAVSETEITDPLLDKIMKIGSIDEIPDEMHDSVMQALLILDHAEKTSMNNYAHAFQPLLYNFDDYALRLLVKGLQAKIPNDVARRDAYFMPDLSTVHYSKRNLLERFGRYLRDNLVFARSIMKLGTLLFCLEYAQKGGIGADGVWKDIEKTYSGTKMGVLYDLLSEVNELRNTRVAHSEDKLSDVNEAWENMAKWVKCLSLLDVYEKEL